MNSNRPPESPELVTVGVLPVQSFVTPAVEVPPGTSARPRPDRPPLPAPAQATGTTSSEGRDDSLAQREALQASAFLSGYLSRVGYDLLRSMDAILDVAEMLLAKADDEGYTAIVPDLEKIRQAGQHLLQLINYILDRAKFGRSPSGS
jgi:signal transduction histidine kinase